MFETLNSPISSVSYPYAFDIKRDDLIDPFVSGNKWRKLKYPIADIQAQGKSHMVTFGGAYSNHLVACAKAAALYRLKLTAFVRGEAVKNPMLSICKLYGMEIIFVSREDYRDKQRLFQKHFANDPQAYFIDEGGAGPLALKGCAEIIAELPEVYDHIFCASGTGSTAAGLWQGIQALQLPTQLHIVPVLKAEGYMHKQLSLYHPQLQGIHIHEDYHFGGYAKTNPQLLAFIQNFGTQNAILLDPVYTSKTAFAITDLIEKGKISYQSKILMIHTGGLLGLMGMYEKF